MNSKSPSTSCDSLNSILTKTTNEKLYQQLRGTQHNDLITLNNIDVNLVDYLNNELVNAGYPSIKRDNYSVANYNLLIENSIDIVARYNRLLASYNRSQEQNHKIDNENESLLRRQQNLKDSQESSKRELATAEEKLRQAQLKSTTLSKTLQKTTDEVKKLQHTIEQRDKQYKHERKKLEKENNKLKERVQVLTTGKQKELPNIDIIGKMNRSSNGTRATWNSDGSKKQIDLYTELIKDYDRKHKELIIENTDLKTFIADLLSNLNHSLKNNSNEVDASFNQSAGNASRLNLDDNCEGTDVDRALCDEIVRLPFDNTFKKVNSEFEKKLELIKNRIQDCSKDPIEIVNGNMANITISSINSFSTTKNHDTVNCDEILNTTFTIEEPSNKNTDKKGGYFFDKTISSSTSSSSASPPSMSLLSEHLEKIQNSNKSSRSNVSNFMSRFQVEPKETEKQSSNEIESSYNEECTIKSELRKLKNDRNKLANEKKYFYEQKLKLDDETNVFRKISTELNKQKKDFEEEQEKYYQAKLFSSFADHT